MTIMRVYGDKTGEIGPRIQIDSRVGAVAVYDGEPVESLDDLVPRGRVVHFLGFGRRSPEGEWITPIGEAHRVFDSAVRAREASLAKEVAESCWCPKCKRAIKEAEAESAPVSIDFMIQAFGSHKEVGSALVELGNQIKNGGPVELPLCVSDLTTRGLP